MVYKLMKRMIEKGNYDSIESMKEKIAVFNLNGTLSDEERDELFALIDKKEA